MKILLNNVGKRYNHQWVFRNLRVHLESSGSMAILGANGSGKSTLLQCIAGNRLLSEGHIEYYLNGRMIAGNEVFRHLAFAAPYLDLPDELTLPELFAFQSRFKKMRVAQAQLAEVCEMGDIRHKRIAYYSSGMKQKVRLLLAVAADVPLLLLDEPASNLDSQGVAWYRNLLGIYGAGKTIVVCSNRRDEEFDFCVERVEVG